MNAVLLRIDELAEHADDLPTVQLAAWFHDAVYRPDRSENEERSAALAERALPELGIGAARTAEVARLVRLTVTHDPAPDDPDGEVLCDADLAVLAGSPDQYAAYAAAVRAEYAFVPDPDFTAGRTAVLTQLLSLPRLFRTPAATTSGNTPPAATSARNGICCGGRRGPAAFRLLWLPRGRRGRTGDPPQPSSGRRRPRQKSPDPGM